ncbi:MAG: cob(I)yrinic acid a,c-diamide adenosyltransferase [Burkholderiales bacterium]|nr:cob(I)yrinic acid a,c-diamide adenosyltransferase [Burkholderiales bacterium]
MGNRLSKIYTKTGDDGSTGLGDGMRVAKNSARIEAIGDIDELNSQLGLLLTEKSLPDSMHITLTRIQHELFELGGELSIPNYVRISDAMVAQLEQELDAMNDALLPLKEFILPGGSRPTALCHVARAVCRRAERRLVALNLQEPVSPAAMKYLNRLSDLLFVMCRAISKELGVPDVLWQPRS